MALYYCVEKEYRDTSWCVETLKGLYAELKRKKQTAANKNGQKPQAALSHGGNPLLIQNDRKIIKDM